MNNKHPIASLHDILRVVKKENVDNFLEDFKNFLEIWAATRSLVETLAPETLEMTIQSVKFVWEDDGKNGINVHVRTIPDKEGKV